MRLRSATGAQAATLVVAATTGVLIAVTAGGSAAPGVHYLTTSVEPATVTDTISATGTVAARATLDLAFGAANQPVTVVQVRVGEHVRAGQLLATVDDRAAQAQLAAAQAAVAEASSAAAATSSPSTGNATLAGSSHGPGASGGSTTVCRTTTVTVTTPKAPPGASPTAAASTSPRPAATATASTTSVSPTAGTAEPTRPVRPSSPASAASGSGTPRTTRTCTTTSHSATPAGAAASATSSHANGSASGAGNTLSGAEQQLATAQAALAATQLEAPQAGVVTTVNARVGTLPGTPAVELRTTGMNVQVPVQEQDAPYVRTGQTATITFAALGVTGTGTVSADALEPATSSSTTSGAASLVGGSTAAVVSYPVTVTIDNTPPGLLPGMSATVSWVATSRNDVLTVPTSALQGNDAGTVVRVLVAGEPRTIPVDIGLSTSSLTQITGGLHAGEQVITGASTS